MPASSGSAMYFTASSPNRRRTNAAIDSSLRWRRFGTKSSAPMRAFAVIENSVLRSIGRTRVGKPSTEEPGSECSVPFRRM